MAPERAGFTLLEALVVCALFGVLGTLLLSLLVPMINAASKGSDVSDLRQMAAVALEAIAEDVEQSAGPGVSVYANPTAQVAQALSVHQVLGVDQSGKSVWAPGVTVYAFSATSHRLWAQSCPPVTTAMVGAPQQTGPFRWVSSDLASFLAAGNGIRLLASDVASFSIAGLSSQGLRPPLVATLAMSRTTSRGTVSMTLQQSALPRGANTHQ